MKEFLMKNKNKTIKIGIIVFVVILIISITSGLVFSRLEKVKITEVNNKISNYIDEVVLYSDDEGKYINFAVEYLYNTTDKNKFTFDEILEVINTTFSVDYTEKDLDKIGVSIRMANKGVVLDPNNRQYTYTNSKTQTDIANTPIIKYVSKKIKRISLTKYKVTYDKYIVENPYEVLNYYDEKNLNEKVEYDTKEITEYLKGNKKISVIKDSINKDIIKEVGKIDGKVTITFKVKNNKVLIKKIG